MTTILIVGAWSGSAQQASSALFNQPHAPRQGLVTLTLKDALALAEKNDPTVLAATTDAAAANEDRRQAHAGLYPSLSGRSEYLGTQGNGKLSESRFVTNDGVHVYRDWAVVHQDLSPGTLSGSAIQRAGAAQALVRAKLEIARRGLAATVTKNYYALIVAQRKYGTAQTALDQARRSLDISQELERGREVAHSDVIRSQLLENSQQQAIQEAKLVMENARLDLAVLLFRDFDEDFSVIDDLDVAPALPSLDEVEAMASRGNPTLTAAIETLRGAHLDVKIARQAFLPTLTVDAAYGIEANAFALQSTVAAAKQDGPLPNLGYFITASLNVPVWDWGVRRSKLKQSELKNDQADTDLSAAQRTLIRDLRGFYDEAQVAHDQIDLLRRAVDLASESLRLNTLRYQAGEAAIIDLVDAQASAVQGRNAYNDGSSDTGSPSLICKLSQGRSKPMLLKIYLAAAATAFLVACSKPAEEKAKPPVPVQVASVTQATIRRIVQGEGALYPVDQASIMPKVSAPVQKFYVNRGDRVKRGQLLAVLENRDLIYAAAESKGAVDEAESNFKTTEVSTVPDSVVKAQTDLEAARESLESTKRVFESRQQLFKQGALAGRLVDDAQVAYAQAEGQYRSAQARLKTLESVRRNQISGAAAQVRTAQARFDSQEAQVAYSRIVSPISGIVADRPLNVGEMSNPGSPVITVVDISRIVARVNVPQSEAAAVRVGQTATFTQPDGKDEVEGKVTVVSPGTDPNTTTVQIWIEVANPGERLKPGMPVRAAIATEVFKAATVVPAAAILPGEEGGTAVLTISPDSVAHRRVVTLGVREGDQVQVLTGAKPGEKVVVVGGMGLDDNTKVKVVTAPVEESDDDDNAPTQKDGAKKNQANRK